MSRETGSSSSLNGSSSHKPSQLCLWNGSILQVVVGSSRMFAEYAGALAEARRACSALRPSDALRAKIEPELRKIEDAAERGLLVDERIEEALLAKPNQFKWQRDVSRAPARDAAPRKPRQQLGMPSPTCSGLQLQAPNGSRGCGSRLFMLRTSTCAG